MIVSIIGSSNLGRMARILNKSKDEIKDLISETAKVIADSGYDILIVPDSAQAFFAKKYREFGGKRVIGAIPKKDKVWGYSWLEEDLCDEVWDAGTWLEQPYFIVSNCDLVVMMGLAPGVVGELSFFKYDWKAEKPMPTVLVVEDFLRQRFPEELGFDLENIKYVKLNELKEAIINFN